MMKFSRTFVSAALMAALCTASCTALAAPDAGSAATAGAAATTAAVPAYNLDADVNRALKTFGVPGMAIAIVKDGKVVTAKGCLLYTSPSPRDGLLSRMPSSA